MQDYYSHYGQGYDSNTDLLNGVSWWNPGAAAGTWTIFILNWGHGYDSGVTGYLGGSGLRPDNADDYRDAFKAANARTEYWVKRWMACCEKLSAVVTDPDVTPSEDNPFPQKREYFWQCKDNPSKEECSAPPDYSTYPWANHAPPGTRKAI